MVAFGWERSKDKWKRRSWTDENLAVDDPSAVVNVAYDAWFVALRLIQPRFFIVVWKSWWWQEHRE